MGSSNSRRYLFICRVLFLLFVSVSASAIVVTETHLDQSRESNGKELLLLLGNRHGRRVLAKEPLEEEQIQTKAKGVDISTISVLQEKKQGKSNNSSSPSKAPQRKVISSSNSSDLVKSMPVSGDKQKKSEKKLTDLPRSSNSKNKTNEEKLGKITQILDQENARNSGEKLIKKLKTTDSEKKNKVPKPSSNKKPISDYEEPDDLIREFRDLPTKLHETLLSDLETISITSKAYLSKANQEITEGFKPLVGNKYAPFVASVTYYIFLILPLLLVSILFNRIKTYFSLQKILLFIQIYLAIYFAILSLTFLFTGIEPLRFFYSSSLSSYVYMQILQTLAYVIYLLFQLLYLLMIFSSNSGVGSKAAAVVGSAVAAVVGLHYYSAVSHRAVLHEPPRTNWKVHAVYAVGFAVVCVCATLERRKKAYIQGGDDGKKS